MKPGITIKQIGMFELFLTGFDYDSDFDQNGSGIISFSLAIQKKDTEIFNSPVSVFVLSDSVVKIGNFSSVTLIDALPNLEYFDDIEKMVLEYAQNAINESIIIKE